MDAYASVNQISLHYLDHPGGAPLVVLLPGLTANAHIFDGLIESGLSLACARWRSTCVAAADDKHRLFHRRARSTSTLLDHLGLAKAVIGGHSFGALVGITGRGSERVEKPSS
jgi:pimeloyl-ACP methyl ester carboxylesterase